MEPTATQRMRELGIDLPPPARPAGSYAPVVAEAGRAWVSGQIVSRDGAIVSPGRVDGEVSVAVAKDLTRTAALQALSALAAHLGSVDSVRRILRVVVYVASSDGFVRQHEVANGATELFIQIFGEAGRPARASVGVTSLPLNAPVEVEILVATD